MTDAEEARRDAEKFARWAWFWRLNLPLAIAYPFLPSWAEPLMLAYLAAVSIIALVVTYDGKAEAAKARAAADSTSSEA